MNYTESKESKQRTGTTFRSVVIRTFGPHGKKILEVISWHDAFIGFIDTYYPEFKTTIYQPNEDYAVGSQFGSYISELHKTNSYWWILQSQLTQYIEKILEEKCSK